MELVRISHMKRHRPTGWQVDKDRWYHRRERCDDASRIEALGEVQAFVEQGRTYAGDAALCRAIDRKESSHG